MPSVLTLAFLSLTTLFAAALPEDDSCAHPDPSSRASMIQVKKKSAEPMFGLSYNMIPIDLRNMGISLFGSLDNLKGLLENTQILNTSYAGVSMSLAMDKKDDASTRFGPTAENGEEYALDTLLDLQPSSPVLNMIDVGGNLGVVTIAVYKKYPGRVRAVVVEPIPTTHFYLRLNLWLNHIPPLGVIQPGFPTPGVGAVQSGISTEDSHVMNFCIPGHHESIGSMNAYLITQQKPCACQTGGKDHCTQVMSSPIKNLFDVFGDEPIHFLKLDCEECEREALTEIQNQGLATRIWRLAGEMHMMEPNIIDLACQYNQGTYLTGMCLAAGQNRVTGKDLCRRCNSDGAALFAAGAPVVADTVPVAAAGAAPVASAALPVAVPAAPVAFGAPATPVDPAAPVFAAAPATPIDPAAPVLAAAPATPVDPAAPAAAATPVDAAAIAPEPVSANAFSASFR